MGKIIGGGFPLAALGASREIMKHFDKAVVGGDKWLMQLGTLSGNPVASVAGLKTMEILRRPGQYEALRKTGKHLQDMQSEKLHKAGIAHQIVGDETLFDVLFTQNSCTDYRSTKHAEAERAGLYNLTLRQHGILKSPPKLYPSLAITDADLDQTDEAVTAAVKALSDA